MAGYVLRCFLLKIKGRTHIQFMSVYIKKKLKLWSLK